LNDRSKYKISSEDLKLVTILETICLTSSLFHIQECKLLPRVVSEGHPDDPNWNAEMMYAVSYPPSTSLNYNIHRIATTKIRWTNKKVCMTWFTKGFIPSIKAHGDNSTPYLL
ncbi:hypothetical protein B0H17DRAFT_849464, partial [Mycena rosella]